MKFHQGKRNQRKGKQSQIISGHHQRYHFDPKCNYEDENSLNKIKFKYMIEMVVLNVILARKKNKILIISHIFFKNCVIFGKALKIIKEKGIT